MRGGSKSETITENIFREFYGNGAFIENQPYRPITDSNQRKARDIKVIPISLEIMRMRIL